MDFDLNSGVGLESINSLGNEVPSEDEIYNNISGDEIDNNTSGDEIDGLTASDSEDGDGDDGGLADDLEGLGCNGDGEIGGGETLAREDYDSHVVAHDNEIAVEEPLLPASNELCTDVVGDNHVVNNTNLGDDGLLSEADNILLRDVEKRLCIGANVRDLDEAYLLYCEYGRLKGFGVRKGEQRYIGRSDTIKWKEFMCCCAGQPDTKRQKEAVPSYKKILIRTGCKAKLRVSRSVGSPWRVSIFLTDHNHGLVAFKMTYMLRSSRNLSIANALILEALQASGIGVSGAVGFLEKQVGGAENLGFSFQDAYDHFARQRKKSVLQNADSIRVMQYFRDKANEEPFYYWNAETDADGRLVNLFFRDMRSAEDYRAFGDVLSLDTTYCTNMYNLICAPFVSINHHTFTIVFGMGFLSDETTSSFEWLLKEFLKSMNGVEPKVIFTDQFMAMMKAIETTFPNAKHRLCQWHINRNAVKKFGSLNGKPAFKKLWYRCMNDVETEGEFDEVWKEIMGYTISKTAPWFTNMYNLRRHWVSVFTRGIFTAGLLATSRSEGTNRVVKSVQKCSFNLYQFVKNYEELKKSWRRKEMEEDTLGIWMPGQLVSENPLFVQATSVYTRKVYKKFETEAAKTFSVVLPHDMRDLGDDNMEFTMTNSMKGRTRTVMFNTKSYFSTCSCRNWESEGILCRHILKVYGFMNHFTIPESQILKRWTKRAKDACFVERRGLEIRSRLPYMSFVQTVMRHMYEMAFSCVDSESGQSFIIEQMDKIRRALFDDVGLPQPKQKRKMRNEFKTNEMNFPWFRDPNVIKEKGFISAREWKSFIQGKKPKGNHEVRKNAADDTHALPHRVPFEMMEGVRCSPNACLPHSAGWVKDASRSRPSSQP